MSPSTFISLALPYLYINLGTTSFPPLPISSHHPSPHSICFDLDAQLLEDVVQVHQQAIGRQKLPVRMDLSLLCVQRQHLLDEVKPCPPGIRIPDHAIEHLEELILKDQQKEKKKRTKMNKQSFASTQNRR